MAEFFAMPKLGMDMEEGCVVKWLKPVGSEVKKGEALVEIETDKSTVEVESTADGVLLRIYCEEGDSRPCGDIIAAIGMADEKVDDAAPAEGKAPAVAAEEQHTPERSDERQEVTEERQIAKPAQIAAEECLPSASDKLRASPRARRLARQNNIELAMVTPSGSSGRIVEQDVQSFMASGGAKTAAAAPRQRTQTVIPVKGIRKITAARMKQSLSEMAQANHRMDVNMTNMISFRRQVNEKLQSAGVKLSFVDLLVSVCAKSLMDFPEVNVSWREDGIYGFNYANIGVAVATERGLVVPVIQDADRLSLTDIAKKSGELIDRARKGTLQSDDMKGGTFTISNLGMYDIDSFTAIINPPESCILAVGKIADRAVAEDGRLVIRPIMTLSLTYDHRVIDGAPAAKFLQTIKGYIENPAWLLM